MSVSFAVTGGALDERVMMAATMANTYSEPGRAGPDTCSLRVEDRGLVDVAGANQAVRGEVGLDECFLFIFTLAGG